MCLAQGPQRSDASEARNRGLGLESSTLPLSHCPPYNAWLCLLIIIDRIIGACANLMYNTVLHF